MTGWDSLENRYRAIILAVGVVLLGACILVAISMIFNWHLHRRQVENFMANEANEHQKLVEEHAGDCPGQGERHTTLTLEEIELRNAARVKRIALIEFARTTLGDEWEQRDVRHFIMHGEPIKQ